MMTIQQKLDLKLMDISGDKLKQLKQIFPEVFSEDEIDYDQLKRVLGDFIVPDTERFGLDWSGRAKCLKSIQQPSIATLKPCREESIDFDTTQNLFIEGDNLEVLKLLQRSYSNKVKMIYIDPPYNTGKDFIYPDNYTENLDTYLKYTGQKDKEGFKFATNTERDGRYHSKWLNMMYPRLYLAKSLLRDDGVIFISIDDNEQANLKLLCDQIFGEENFVTQICWRKSDNQANIGNIARVKEYILVYCKSCENFGLNKIPLTDKAKKEYRYSDSKGQFRRSILLDKTRGRHIYEIRSPSGFVLNGPWMKKQEEFIKMQVENKIYWASRGEEQPYGKIYLHESIGQIANDFLDTEFGSNQEGGLELEKLLSARYFDFPKPTSLIRHFVNLGSNTKQNDLILDFFSGSSATAHAVMQLNAEDAGNRKYIMVQLPERCDKNSEAYKAGYKTIADIGKERIRRAAAKIRQENHDYQGDLGFKVFKLDRSNFKIWNSDLVSKEEYNEQLKLHINHVVDNTTKENILYEIILGLGLTLTSSITIIPLSNKKEVFSLEEGKILICLEKIITEQLIEEMTKRNPDKVIFLDEGFQNNDQLKVNAGYNFENHIYSDQDKKIEFITI